MDIFKRFDKDRDGYLTIQDLDDGLAATGMRLSDAELRALFDVLDDDRSGEVDFHEFRDGLQYHNLPISQQQQLLHHQSHSLPLKSSHAECGCLSHSSRQSAKTITPGRTPTRSRHMHSSYIHNTSFPAYPSDDSFLAAEAAAGTSPASAYKPQLRRVVAKGGASPQTSGTSLASRPSDEQLEAALLAGPAVEAAQQQARATSFEAEVRNGHLGWLCCTPRHAPRLCRPSLRNNPLVVSLATSMQSFC